MAVLSERKAAVVQQYRTHETDTGSPEVQVALLSERINMLTEPFQDAQEGLPQPPGPSQARRPAAPSARLSEDQGQHAVPEAH
jgi:hypothetical protein